MCIKTFGAKILFAGQARAGVKEGVYIEYMTD